MSPAEPLGFSLLGAPARLAAPAMLWLLLAVAALGALGAAQLWRRRALLARAAGPQARRLAPRANLARPAGRLGLSLTGLALLALALARPQCGTRSELTRRLGVDVAVVLDVSSSMLAQDVAAGEPPGDTGHQLRIIDLHLDHVVQRSAGAQHQLAQGIGLFQCAGKAVEDEAALGAILHLRLDQADDDLVRHQLAPRHDAFDAAAQLGALGDGLLQHIAGGKLHHAARLFQPFGLRSLARAWRPQKDDVRHLGQRRAGAFGADLAPGFLRPRSCDFSISASYWCARRCDWTCWMVSIVTETTISTEVPPK